MRANLARILAAATVLLASLALASCGSSRQCVSGAAVQAQWDATPAHGTWRASPGECVTTTGLTVPHPMTVDGGSFIDTAAPDGHYLHPVIEVNRTGSVTLENLSVAGTDASGAYNIPSVNNAGILLASTWDVTIQSVFIARVWGDGIELFSDPPSWEAPNTNVVINAVTIATTGRQGITVGQVNGGKITNVSIAGQHFDAFDFESDLVGQGSGNVTIDHCTTGDAGFWLAMAEPLSGPVTVQDCSGGDLVSISNPGPQPVTLWADRMVGLRMSGGAPDIRITGAAHVTIGYSSLARTPAPPSYAEEYAPTAPPVTPGSAVLLHDTGFGWPLPKGTP